VIVEGVIIYNFPADLFFINVPAISLFLFLYFYKKSPMSQFFIQKNWDIVLFYNLNVILHSLNDYIIKISTLFKNVFYIKKIYVYMELLKILYYLKSF
jgi:hypothetical protein